jgi:hypothetical protein
MAKEQDKNRKQGYSPANIRIDICLQTDCFAPAASLTRIGQWQLTVFTCTTLEQAWRQDRILTPQCAFKMSMLNVSAIRIKSRSWLRFSSTHEPSDPPLGII